MHPMTILPDQSLETENCLAIGMARHGADNIILLIEYRPQWALVIG
jgi:hypothetical protein